MRSAQVYRALDQIPNRFSLCMYISRGVHLTHTNGQSLENSVTTAIEGIESGRFLRAPEAPMPVLVEARARVLPMSVHRPVIVLAG